MASVPMPAWFDDIKPAARATEPQKPIALLPATTAIRNSEWRQIRRQLAKMCGPRPRYIPSAPVMAMGPGKYESPYQPEQIAEARATYLKEMGTAIELWAMRFTAPGKMVHHLDWEATNATERLMHAAFVFANLMMAV